MDRIAAQLGVGRRVGLGWPLLLSGIAAAASVALLGISGWFLTGSAIAGAGGLAAVTAFNYLLPSAAIRALAIARTAARYGERLTSHSAALTAMAGLRTRLFGTLAAADPRTSPDLASGEASTRLIDDIAAIEDLVVRRSALPGALVGGLVATGCIALSGWLAAIVFIVLAGIGLIAGAVLARRVSAGPACAAAQARGRVREHYVELAAARPEIIAYGLAERVEAALAEDLAVLDAARRSLARGEAALNGLVALWSALLAVVILLVADNGPALAALAALAAFAGSEALAIRVRSALREAVVAEGLARVGALAAIAPQSAPEPNSAALPIQIGDLHLEPGARIVVTGDSGSGKTTLVETLAGLRPAPLPLSVGAVPVAQAEAAMLAAQFALAPQSAQLIAGTIGDNLRLARPGVDEAAMWAALDVVCLAERVRAMPGALDCFIGEGGGTLSGGEQKRLSLARALLANRPWLVADEPSEGLDPATEAELVARLDAWLTETGTGLILVSHRPGPRALCQQSLALPLA
ncbi:MAG: ATP-binding cassette domain-containing protein [Sphingomonas sp.]